MLAVLKLKDTIMKKYLLMLVFSFVFTFNLKGQCLCETPTIEFHNLFESYYYCDCCPTYIDQPDSLVKFMNFHENDSNNIWQVAYINKGDWNGDFNWPNYNGKAIITDSTNSYPINNHSVFELKINKPTCSSWFGHYCWGDLYFSFRYKCDTDTLTDGLYIEVSFDNGQTFANAQDTTLVKLLPNGPVNLGASHYNKLRNSYGISGSSNSNGYSPFNLSFIWDSLSQSSVQDVIFRFNFISDSVSSNKKGIVIDDLSFILTHNCFTKAPLNNISDVINLFPNPINNSSCLTFNNPNHKIYMLNVIDAKGNIVFIQQTDDNFFKIGECISQSGFYVYYLYSENKIVKHGKFIKL